MNRFLRRLLPAALALTLSASAHAQFYRVHDGILSFNGTGQFTTVLTQSPNTTTYGQAQQFNTDAAGFVGSFQEKPLPFAGVEFNYGYTHLSERYTYFDAAVQDTVNDSTGVHEATSALMFHPKFGHLAPFLNVGGGAIDFRPLRGANQWRGAGLVELGFDVTTKNPHFGFRVQGRSLYYRYANFYTPQIATHAWVATTEPSLGTYWRF